MTPATRPALQAPDRGQACPPWPTPLADSGDQLNRCLVLTQLPQGKDERLLTLYSADTPRSVSRSELHGNWPVTLYKFTEKLGDNGTEL